MRFLLCTCPSSCHESCQILTSSSVNTIPLYYSDPYRKECEATVIAVLEDGIVTDQTVFYPGGGGQRGDRGLISGVEVLDTLKRDGDIVHIVPDPSAFHTGQSVHLSLDWEKRHTIMKAHSAQHMIAGTLYSHFSVGTVAIHLSDDFLTVETDSNELSLETLYEVERLVCDAIAANHSVRSYVLPHSEAEGLGLRRSIKVDGDVRIVEIEGVDRIACGGVHVASTGEIGRVSYEGQETIRGHVRTLWSFGDAALRLDHRRREVTRLLSTMLSSPLEGLGESVEALQGEVKRLKGDMKAQGEAVASALVASGEKVIHSPVDLSFFQKLCSGERRFFALKGKAWLLCADRETYEAFRSHFTELGIKGGGRGPLYQGMTECGESGLLECIGPILEGR